MSKVDVPPDEDDLRAEYAIEHFKNGVRGKYATEAGRACNMVVIAPDLCAAFPNQKAVNDALRALLAMGAVRQPAPKD